MSKTTQENPAVENSATDSVSNTSTGTKRTSKRTNTATRSNTSTTKTTRTRTTSRAKTTASTQTKAPSNTNTSVQQDKIMSQNTVRRVAKVDGIKSVAMNTTIANAKHPSAKYCMRRNSASLSRFNFTSPMVTHFEKSRNLGGCNG